MARNLRKAVIEALKRLRTYPNYYDQKNEVKSIDKLVARLESGEDLPQVNDKIAGDPS